MNRFSFSHVRAGAVAVALVALPTVFAARPANAQFLFVAGDAGQFGVLNAQNGAYNSIANTTFGGLNTVLAGLGVGSDGIVYAIDAGTNSSLYSIDTRTAILTRIGSLGFSVPGNNNYSLGLTSTANGSLYAYFGQQATGGPINSLYSVDRTNAATTLIGSTNQAFDGGFSDDGSGNLYSNSGDRATVPNSLISLNSSTGAATARPTTNANYATTFGLGYSSALYGFTQGGSILTITPSTGAAVTTGTYNTANSGFILGAARYVTTSSSAPEPGTLTLLGMGLTGGLGIVARRRKHASK